MKRIYLLAFMLCMSQLAFSQSVLRQFGSVSRDELSMDTYEKEPQAAAVILSDVGEVVFKNSDGDQMVASSSILNSPFSYNNGGRNVITEAHKIYFVEYTRTKRIKILSEEGKKYAEVTIPLLTDGVGQTEQLASVEAYTYNLSDDGVKVRVPLDQGTITEVATKERKLLKQFTFPNVKVGSVLEFKYVIQSPFYHQLPVWTFQSEIPTLYSKYTAAMVPFYDYIYQAQGIDQFDEQYRERGEITRVYGTKANTYSDMGGGFEFKDMIYTFVMKDVPAFKDIVYITSPNDYLMKLHFQLAKFHDIDGNTMDVMSTWENLNNEMLKHNDFGRYLKKSKKYAKKLSKSDQSFMKAGKQKTAQAIVEYVQNNFEWNGLYSRLTSQSAKDFYESKSGNSADINLFLVALLKYSGIDAKPVLLSTRAHGKVRTDHPFVHYFNHVIVLVNTEKPFLTDASEKQIAIDHLPIAALNDKGLVVEDSKAQWINLNPTIISQNISTINLTIDPENATAQAQVLVKTTEYEAFDFKKSFEDDKEKLKVYFKQRGFTELNGITTHNFDDVNKAYIMKFNGVTKLENKDSKLEILPFLNFPLQQNKLTERKRLHPVDLTYAKTDAIITNIQLPEGYEIAELPESYQTDNELVAINLEFRKLDDVVAAKADYTFKKPVYQPEDYARIKNYMRIIVEKFNQPVVLKKTSEEQARK